MLRTLRQQSRWIFYILTVAFVGWLAFQGVYSLGYGGGCGGSAGGDVVLKVNGMSVHAADYQAALQAAYDQYRQQHGAAPVTRDDDKALQDQVVAQFVQQILLAQEYRRLGITVQDQEVVQTAQSSPPPEMLSVTEFQTTGQFDIGKWQRYLATADPQVLIALEARYRDQILQTKLVQYLTADVYVSDAKLWRIYRDRHESVKVALLAVYAQQVPCSEASLSDRELERYYAAHDDDFKRPATAYLSYVALPRLPTAADTAAALARAAKLRTKFWPQAQVRRGRRSSPRWPSANLATRRVARRAVTWGG